MKRSYFNPTTEIVEFFSSNDVLQQLPDNPPFILTTSPVPYSSGYNM